MSADDFQTKYASVMESMLKGAVAETTKLFETMVDDLKAEITKIKKENEDLKRKCSQFEDERGKTVCDIQERESDPRRSDGSGKRDTAVQCDLVPFRTVLVEQCEPLQPSSWQNQVQQCGFDTMQYVWQEHNYENRDERNSQMAVILVKQEDLVDSSQQSDFKQEDGSPLMSDGVLEKEGHVVNEEYPSAEIPSALENEDTQVSLELFNVGLDNSLLGVHNQPSDLGNSLSALKGDREKGSGIGMQISETRTPEDPMTLEKHPTVIAQNQPEIELHENEQPADGKVSVNEQTDADLPSQLVDTQYTEEQSSKPTPPNKSQAVDESKNATSEAEPPPPVRRRRGRPPKKAKPVKQVLLPSSTVSAEQEVKNSPTTRMGKTKASIVESLNITSSRSSLRSRIHPKESSPFINLSVQEKVNTFLEDKENSTVDSLAFLGSPQSRKPSFENKKASETHQLSMVTKDGSAQASPIELSSTAQKQNSPTTESPQEPSLRSRERCTSVTLQDAMLLVEAMNQSTEENTQCSPQKVAATAQTLKTVEEARVESEKQLIPEEAKSHAPPQTTDATATTEARAHIKNTTPKQQHPATPSTAGKPSVATSTTATQTNVKSFQEHPPHPTLKSVMQSKQSDSVHHKIIVMSRSSTSVMSCKFAGKSQTQLPSVVSTVIAAQNNGELPRLTPTGTLPGKPSLCSIPQKTLYVSPQKLHPVISLQSTPPPPDPRSGPLSQPKLTILIPRQQSAAATRKQSQAADLSTKQESAKSSDAVQLTPSEFMSSSQVFRVSDDAQITFDEAAPITENLEPHQQTLNEPSDTSSSLDLSYGPTAMSSASPLIDDQKPSAVIRLIRLPFQMSTKEAVLLSHLSTSESSDTESVSKERTMKEKPSFLGLSVQPLETRVSPSDTYCISKETSVAVSDKTSQISDIQEGASLDTVSDEPTDREYVQFSAPPFLKSATAIHATESSASFGMPSEPSATQLEKEIRSMLVQGSAGPEDPPMEPQSPAVIHLLSIKSRDITDPHVQMTKAQFLAQLAVSPIVQEQNQTFNSVDADASCLTSTSDKKSIQRNNLVAKLRCHLKTHSQARNSVRNQEPCTETETLTASPKKPRLETDSPDDPMTGPVPLSLDKQGTVVDTTAPEKTEDDPSPISSRKSGVCKDGVRSKRCVSEPAPVNSRRLKAMNDSILVSHGRSTSGKDCVGSKNKFTSVSPRSTSAKESASLKKTKGTSPSLRGSGLTKESPKKIKTSTVRKSISLRDNTSPKSDGETPKQTKSRVKRNDSIIKSGTDLQSVGWVKLTESVISSQTGESSPAQKHKLIQEGSGPNENLRVTKSQKLAKAAEATTEARISKSAGSTGDVRKLSAKGVWTPPIMPLSKTSPAGGKSSPNSTPMRTDTKTPKQTLVYPPSIPLHPIPVRAPPVVSPLQPLSVIGWRLLKNQCGECGRILSSSAALESHVSLHTGHRPFSCKLCGKRFPDSKGLKRHGRVHRNGRIHVCQQCGKGFVYSFGLTKHLQMVHSRIKPFVCQVCNKGFYSKRDVEAHIRIHTGEKPFHCNLCEKKFARRTELNVHLRWHNGEKRHWCPYCGKGFLDINNLKRHKYIHTGEKPHSCPHCPKHFTQSGHLKKHVKNVHKIQ